MFSSSFIFCLSFCSVRHTDTHVRPFYLAGARLGSLSNIVLYIGKWESFSFMFFCQFYIAHVWLTITQALSHKRGWFKFCFVFIELDRDEVSNIRLYFSYLPHVMLTIFMCWPRVKFVFFLCLFRFGASSCSTVSCHFCFLLKKIVQTTMRTTNGCCLAHLRWH